MKQLKARTKADLLSKVEKPVASSKIVAHSTLAIQYEDGSSAIRYHDTDIITWRKGHLILNSGGFRTKMTKERINEFAPVHIWQSKGVWTTSEGYEFFDGIEFDADKKIVNPSEPIDMRYINSEKRRIQKFVAQITKDNLPEPAIGDCVVCRCWSFSEQDCLASHVEENYLNGTLLYNAMLDNGCNERSIWIHYQIKSVDKFRRAVRKYLTKRLIPELAI